MTETEINQAIAEALDYSLIEPPEEDGTRAFSLREPATTTLYPWRETKEEAWADAPNFYRDLNACAEMEEKLFPDQRERYGRELEELCLHESETLWVTIRFKLVHATAPQRCEAFLKTIGKWKE